MPPRSPTSKLAILAAICIYTVGSVAAEDLYFYPGTVLIGEVRGAAALSSTQRSKSAAASLGSNGYSSKRIGLTTNDFEVKLPRRRTSYVLLENANIARRHRKSLNPCNDRRVKRIMRACAGACSCSPNWRLHSLLTPIDTYYADLWGMNQGSDIDIDAPEAWDVSTGSASVLVGVVDTGIDYNHPDLAANVWTNPDEIAANGIDDDANGVIDDIHGMNAIVAGVARGDPLDDNNHGSHCSGTIGGVGNNGTGVVGVNWNVQLVGLKFLDAGGSGSTTNAIAALNYFTALKTSKGLNARVTNNSWGGGGFSQSLRNSIEAAGNAGIGFMAAAGNNTNDNDANPSYPASYGLSNMLAVAAVNQAGALAGFSNFGVSSVQIGAPGVGIKSTTINNTYQYFQGTSMATPHVTGVFALVAAAYPGLSMAEIITAIKNGASTLAGLDTKVQGSRFLNARGALDQASGADTPTPLPTSTATQTPSATATPTATPIPTETAIPSITPTPTIAPTLPSPTETPTGIPTELPTVAPTPVSAPVISAAVLLNYNSRKRIYESGAIRIPGFFGLALSGTGSGAVDVSLAINGVSCGSRSFSYDSALGLAGAVPKSGAFRRLRTIQATVSSAAGSSVRASAALRAPRTLRLSGDVARYCARALASLK